MAFYSLDDNGIPGKPIEDYQSLIWNMQYWGMGDFEIVLPGTQEYVDTDIFSIGRLLVRDIDMSSTAYKNVMRIERRQLSFEGEEGWKLTIGGRGLKAILKQRAVYPQITFNGSVVDSIRKAISENITTAGVRQIPNVQILTNFNTNDTFTCQLLGENLGEWVEETCTKYGLGWDIYLSINGSSRIKTVEIYRGENRTYNQNVNTPVIFSPEYDNLTEYSYSEDVTEQANAAIVGGEERGDLKTAVSIGTSSGMDRYETYIDGSSVSSNGEVISESQYEDLLREYGNTELAEQAYKPKVAGVILPDGVFKLNKDFYLGDVVQIDCKGVTATTRIVEIVYSEDESGTLVTPTFSEWEES